MKHEFLQQKYFDELNGDGDGSGEGMDGGLVEGAAVLEGDGEEAPDYFVGELTADQVIEQLQAAGQLPEHLRGLESRVEAQVSPVMERMTALQEQLGTQQKFEPKLDKVRAVLEGYDAELAKTLLPALMEDLGSSMSSQPLGPDALTPHVNPMIEQALQAQMAQVVPALLDNLPFDAEGVVNRDPADASKILEPSTELQKEFKAWWDQADAPTRQALSNYDTNYARALHKFGKWRAERTKGKGEAVGAASARLSSSRPVRSGGTRQQPQPRLESESDGFNSVFSS